MALLERPFVEFHDQAQPPVDCSCAVLDFCLCPVAIPIDCTWQPTRGFGAPIRVVGLAECKEIEKRAPVLLPGQFALPASRVRQQLPQEALCRLDRLSCLDEEWKTRKGASLNNQLFCCKGDPHSPAFLRSSTACLKSTRARCIARSTAPPPPRLSLVSQNFGPVSRSSNSWPRTQACHRLVFGSLKGRNVTSRFE